MLAYLLALVIGFGSFSLYLSAFFLPELYRKHDLLWSGVGLFYSLVLWVCAGRITGALLLGQIASVALLSWLGWQTLNLRFAQTIPDPRTQVSGATSLQEAIRMQWARLRLWFQDGSWRIYLSRFLDRLPQQAADFAKAAQGWIEALISTTLQPQEFSDSSDESLPTQEVAQEVKGRVSDRPIVPSASAQTPDPGSVPAIPTEPLPKPTEAAAEFSAEWDDLELEVYPELETTEGIPIDPQTPDLPPEEKHR